MADPKYYKLNRTDNIPVQVQSAIEDQEGNEIKTHTAPKTITFTYDSEIASLYTDYPYVLKAEIAGVKSTDTAIITFSPDDAVSGNMAPVSNTIDGAVEIFGRETKSIAATVIIMKG